MSYYNFETDKHVSEGWQRLGVEILNTGIRERDYFDYDRGWLDTLCRLADTHPDVYMSCLDFIYGPRNRIGGE